MTPHSDHDTPEISEINVTPFIDVMLVLLIIFMVAAPLSTVDVPITLPQANAAPAPQREDPIWLTLTAEGKIFLGDGPVSEDDLPQALMQKMAGKSDLPIHLRADRTVDYAALMGLLDQLRAAGFAKVALVAAEGTK